LTRFATPVTLALLGSDGSQEFRRPGDISWRFETPGYLLLS
jgi:hypothetical protein